MEALIHSCIMPAHRRTIFLKDILWDKIHKFKLNIPQMLVGYNLSRTYYFPIKIAEVGPEYTKHDQFYSPFANTYAEGYICLGQTFPGNLNKIINTIYNSLWKFEPTCGSFCYYISNAWVTAQQGQERYIEFLKEWERTGQLNLKYRNSYTFCSKK